ncbi:unnamed protein product [Mycena citricolor]|uniref:Uncharacterized protein n=1 Tax=Mycena citricolor TaxID=2018698 RepID=A0AAD2HMQ1_9AGAR|nr:unnamed protein product [Mycena citricolor]
MVSLTPQIMIPLAADLAPPERRGSALSIVIPAYFSVSSWPESLLGSSANSHRGGWYYLAIGVQVFVLLAGYLIIPDYPAKNTDLTPGLLVNLASCACFTNFWVTLTFLLGGAPYFYSTLTIGLFGLIGILSVVCGPLFGKLIDGLMPCDPDCCGDDECGGGRHCYNWSRHVPSVAADVLGGSRIRLREQVERPIRAVGVWIFNAIRDPFLTKVYTAYGWRAAAALNMGFYGWILIVLLVRGPHCGRFTWFGYEGWAVKKVKAAQTMDDTQSKSSSVGGDQEAAPSEK